MICGRSEELRSGRCCGRLTPSVSLRSTASPKGTPLAKRVSFVLIGQRPKEVNRCQCALCLCQSLHLWGRWHFAKRNDGRGPSRFAAVIEGFLFGRCCGRLTPSVSLRSTASPKGTPLAKRVSFVLIGQRLEAANRCQCALCLCQSLHLRGRWHFAKRNDGRGPSPENATPLSPYDCLLPTP